MAGKLDAQPSFQAGHFPAITPGFFRATDRSDGVNLDFEVILTKNEDRQGKQI
jgi:hypothetical protein